MGDSVAVGIGADRPLHDGYVPVLHRRLTTGRGCAPPRPARCRLRLRSLAFPGATTDSLLAQQLPDAVAALAGHSAGDGGIGSASLVTLDVGGNDVFVPVLQSCPEGATPSCLAAVRPRLAQVRRNYAQILTRLRAAAGPSATVAVMTYYNPLPACQLADRGPLARLVLEGGEGLPAGLNDVIRAAARARGVTVVETPRVIGPEDLVGGADCLHPDDSGHARIAAAFLRAVRGAG